MCAFVLWASSHAEAEQFPFCEQTVTIAQFLEFFPALCSLWLLIQWTIHLYLSLSITAVSYLLITEYTGGLNVYLLLFLGMPPKLLMFGKQCKAEMLNSQTGRMASYMNNMQWSPRYCPHYYTNWNAMRQDTKQTELICSLFSW